MCNNTESIRGSADAVSDECNSTDAVSDEQLIAPAVANTCHDTERLRGNADAAGELLLRELQHAPDRS